MSRRSRGYQWEFESAGGTEDNVDPTEPTSVRVPEPVMGILELADFIVHGPVAQAEELGAAAPRPPPPEALPTASSRINTDYQQQQQLILVILNASATEVAKLLECPGCYNILLPPIFLCEEGHSICSDCRKLLKECPTCRGHITEIRNRIEEEFVEMCMIQCKYGTYGCEVELRGSELAAHQIECATMDNWEEIAVATNHNHEVPTAVPEPEDVPPQIILESALEIIMLFDDIPMVAPPE